MILYHNLSFFDKNGKNLNLQKTEYVTVTVNRNDDTVVDYIDAVIEVITNEYGQLEKFFIKNPGTKYNEKLTILVSDKDTEKEFLIDSSEFITLGPSGEILDIQLPSKPFGFCYPSFEYSGEVYFPKISTGLIETGQIYVLEEMVDEVTGDFVYSSPRTYKNERDIVTTELHAKFNTEQDEEIKLFDVDYDSDKYPFINDIQISTMNLEDGLNDEIINTKRQVILLRSNALLYNVYIRADEEGIYERTLTIYETVSGNDYVIATIKFRAEVEGEDERLRLMLDNFGIQINEQELKLFRDSDINETLPNYLLLNEKRKEMLLEYHNIFPYIGSYKALVNIINYFGYGDTRLKEYWLNARKTNGLKSSREEQFSKLFAANNPIDLTSLHSFGNTFKPIPKLSNHKIGPLVPRTEPKPKFDEDNVEFKDRDGNLTVFPKTESGKGVTGKRPYVIPDNIKPPEDNGATKIPEVDTTKLIGAIREKEKPLDDTEIKSIYEQYFKQVEIPMQLKQKGKHWQSEEMLPNKVWKKTNLFGLFYDITRESGEYDIYGMPITEDAFIFSEDEVLIKLFGLREYLKEKFMPLNARIIDIVGEGIYFERWAVNIWKDDVVNYEVNQFEDLDFDIETNENLILDLQDYGGKVDQPTGSTNIKDIENVFLNNFSNNNTTFKNDDGPVGCRATLSIDDFDITWDDLDITWDELYEDTRAIRRAYTDGTSPYQISLDIPNRNIIVDYLVKDEEIVPHFTEIIMHSEDGSGNPYTQKLSVESWDPITKIMHIAEIDGDFSIATNAWIEYIYYKHNLASKTWDTLGQGDYYEMEWYVSHEEDGKFDWNVRGDINIYKKIQIDLPYTGKYYVKCILYDLTNHSVRKTKTIDVKMPNVDFMCFGRQINAILTWDDMGDVTWDELHCQWRNIAIPNDVTWDDLDGITWDDLDISRYQDQEKPFIQNNTKNILRISEKDRYVGNITGIDALNNKVVCEGHFANPMLRNAISGIPQDYIYFRLDDAIYKRGVISADYSNPTQTTVIVDTIPEGLTTSWELLREVGRRVVIEGDVSYNTNTNEGLKVGQYAMFTRDESETPLETKLEILDVIQPISNQDYIRGIVLPKAIDKHPAEYGRIYKVRTIKDNVVGSPSVPTYTFNSVNKTITLEYAPYENEIIPGFTILNVSSETYDGNIVEQRLQVQHMKNIPGGVILDVVELDSDMGIMYNSWVSTITYEYWQFGVKLRHFIDSSENNTDVYLNFNDYPYHTNFVNDGTPEYMLNGEWFFDYVIKDGSFSLEVENLGFDANGNTVVTLKDTESELYRLSPKFKMTWATFDEDYAERHFGTDIFTWDNLDTVTWDDLSHLTWNMFEYQKAPLCGFKITKVAPNGRIQFNELPFFEFTTVPAIGPGVTEYDQLKAAVDELNATENEGLQRFTYNLVEKGITPDGYEIVAVAKNEGIYFLGYLIFDGGVYGEHSNPAVSHTYPLGSFTQWNNPYIYGPENYHAAWNPVSRAYYEFGYDYSGNKGWYPAEKIDNTQLPPERYVYNPAVNSFLYFNPEDLSDPIYSRFPSLLNSVEWRYDDAYRLLYDYALTSPFTWDDLIASKNEINIKKLTTLFFVATNTKVAGKKKYEWEIKRREDNKIMCVVGKPFVIWTFAEDGNYDVSLKVTDINGNTSYKKKNAFVVVN